MVLNLIVTIGILPPRQVMSKSEVISNDAVQQCKDEVTIQYCLGHHPFIVQVIVARLDDAPFVPIRDIK